MCHISTVIQPNVMARRLQRNSVCIFSDSVGFMGVCAFVHQRLEGFMQ